MPRAGDAEELRTTLSGVRALAHEDSRLVGYCDDENPFWGVEVTYRETAVAARARLVRAGCVADSPTDVSRDVVDRDGGEFSCSAPDSRFHAFVDPRGAFYPDRSPRRAAPPTRVLFVPTRP